MSAARLRAAMSVELARSWGIRLGEDVSQAHIAALDELERLLAADGIVVHGPQRGGRFSLAVRARVDGIDAVVKVVPEVDLAAREAAVLAHWAPVGLAPLLVRDGAIRCGDMRFGLVATAWAGQPLSARGPLAIPAACAFARAAAALEPPRLGDPVLSRVPAGSVHLAARAASARRRIEDGSERGRTARSILGASVDLVDAALEGPVPGDEAMRVLHADLHPGNLLVDGPGPAVAIDPKGAVGDPLLDLAQLAVNCPGPGTLGASWDDVTAEATRMGLVGDRSRLDAWGRVVLAEQLVVSAWYRPEVTGPRAVEALGLLARLG